MNFLNKILFFSFVCFQLQSFAQYTAGNGSESNPYSISSANQLINLSQTPSDWTKHFKLTNNIDMNGLSFTPIGNSTQSFSGNFNGGFYTISNLSITPPTELLNGTGMFGKVRGHIYNLGISNVSIDINGYSRVGAFAGILEAGGTIKQCFSLGGTINVGNGGWTGGIVGAMFSGSANTVQDCYSSTNISGSWGCGGIVGVTRGAHSIDRVVFYGTVTGGNAIVSIQNDTADAQKNGIAPTHAFFASSTGASDSEAVSLTSEQLTQTSNYIFFDFNNIWKIDSELGYAVLQMELPEIPFFEKIRTQRVTSSNKVVWKNFGPGTSGYCEEFWCHPTDPNVMFSGPDMHAAFGTWDNGKTWQTLKDYDGTGVDLRRVIDIKFSLTNPDYGMLFDNNQTGSSTSGKIFETHDRGRTWSYLKTMGKAHSKLAVHPTNDNIWFLGAGDFWNVKENHRSLAKPNGIKIGRADYGHVWKTTDKGKNWKKVATSISSDLDVGRIIFNPADPSVLIMATGQGMFRSTDTGETWTASATGLPHNLPRDLTSYYNKETGEFILYTVEQTKYTPNGTSITTTGGVYKSTDTGLTWQRITGNLGLNLQTINNYFVQDRYHRSVAYWLGISKADSKNTYTTYPIWTLPVYNRLVVNPMDKNELYLVHNKKHDKGFGPGDVWKSEDGGATWFACARSGSYWIAEENKSYWEAKNNPTGANIDFAHLQVAQDEGTEGAGTRMLAINSIGQVFTGIEQQLLRSNNKGVSWSQVDDDETSEGSNKWIGRGNTNLPGRFLLLETGVPGRKLLCSGEHGLWQTTDIGDWPDADAVAVEQIEGQVHDHSGNHGAHSISTVAVHPNNPDIIYFIAWRQEHRGKFRKSTDGGKTWENIATIFEADNGSWESVGTQYSLIIDPVNPNNIYFTSIYKPISEIGGGKNVDLTKGAYGVYRSTDGGYNWSVSNNDFPVGSSINRIAMHPDNPQVIFAAMNQWGTNDSGGLYKSVDGAVNFTKMTIPSVIKSVNNIFIDRNTKDLFISTGSRSGTLEGGGVWKSTDDGTNWERIFQAPYVWQTEVSPANSNIITISVAAQVPNQVDEFLNPGAYLSIDAGATWTKINKGLAHSDRIVDIKPDPIDENVLWCAGWGSAWYKATFTPSNLSVEETPVEKQEITIYPNPVTGYEINISGLTNFSNNVNYTIINTLGEIVRSNKLLDQKIEITQLNEGFYFLILADENKKISRKFLIKK
ncbi:VPS10 domain-containing protein [Flavicella sediminum]|uniref:VPS10 domain-containing protein n=1 Tax=Flavicella sediminum TaxID=2585141 RepID=UPI001122035B|nr:T9SS type A sorting domain-containing protein [Flavicella sediminum]